MEKFSKIYRKLAVVSYCIGEFVFYPLLAAPAIPAEYNTLLATENDNSCVQVRSSIEKK